MNDVVEEYNMLTSDDLTMKWNDGTLTVEDVRQWAKRQRDADSLLTEEFNHVTMCMHHIYRWHIKEQPIGNFLYAVIRNDFKGACGRADDTNRKVLPLFACFLYNVAPYDYSKRRT